MESKIPDQVYLQWFGNAEPHDELVCEDEVTHSLGESVYDWDILYISADRYVLERDAHLIAKGKLEAALERVGELEAANPETDWDWEYFTPSESNPIREGDEILRCRRPRDLLNFTQEEKDDFIERTDHE